MRLRRGLPGSGARRPMPLCAGHPPRQDEGIAGDADGAPIREPAPTATGRNQGRERSSWSGEDRAWNGSTRTSPPAIWAGPETGCTACWPRDRTISGYGVNWPGCIPGSASRQWPAATGTWKPCRTPKCRRARRIFERSCGNDPLRILLALKFQGDIATVDADTRERLLNLQRE